MNTTRFNPDLLYSKYLDITNAIYEDISNRLGCNIEDYCNKICYVSGPSSHIANYKERFQEVVSFLESSDKFSDYFILNPMELIDKYNTEDYIVGCLLSIYMVNISDIVVIDDRDDNWENSRGVLIELTTAVENNKEVLSFKALQEAYYDI